MKILFFALLIFSNNFLFAQNKINLKLKHELDSLSNEDQKYRAVLENCYADNAYKDSVLKKFNIKNENDLFPELMKYQQSIDFTNLVFAEKVIKKYGMPSKKLVGDSSNQALFYVIQHSNLKKMEQYINMFKKASLQNELDKSEVAMMEDRILMQQGKEQIYGTQIRCSKLKNSDEPCFVWPIKDPKNVNKRRRLAGFDETVEENAKRLYTVYRVVNLSEVK